MDSQIWHGVDQGYVGVNQGCGRAANGRDPGCDIIPLQGNIAASTTSAGHRVSILDQRKTVAFCLSFYLQGDAIRSVSIRSMYPQSANMLQILVSDDIFEKAIQFPDIISKLLGHSPCCNQVTTGDEVDILVMPIYYNVEVFVASVASHCW